MNEKQSKGDKRKKTLSVFKTLVKRYEFIGFWINYMVINTRDYGDHVPQFERRLVDVLLVKIFVVYCEIKNYRCSSPYGRRDRPASLPQPAAILNLARTRTTSAHDDHPKTAFKTFLVGQHDTACFWRLCVESREKRIWHDEHFKSFCNGEKFNTYFWGTRYTCTHKFMYYTGDYFT